MMEELKSCPFCDDKVISMHIDRLGLSYIQCDLCNARIWSDGTRCSDPSTAQIVNKLVKTWNTRKSNEDVKE